ncbi:universal stress protein [Brevibacterium marinum]|uniref:Nucleotide-binding universal stress UspA family protein n=1 Tax=Brevibacterium marinum TaxID=418643 RepID=A0A846RYC5_9MICO|nr:universal stress protein [Brevibacterium marinum]NJC56946.1 nucleotide-binding universal stress UspA family protein [Brevibacterium marinum]
MTDFYSTPQHRYPAPSLRMAASAGIDDARRTIVLAYRADSSPAVLDQAIAAARRENAALRAVHFDTDTTTAPSTGALSDTRELAEQLTAAEVEFEIQRADSDVASQIIDLAEHSQAELIVVASKRRSPVVKLLLGSSTQRVILEAECPVLIVK